MKYNIYCDESCHLPNDDSSLMVIGGISCPQTKARAINMAIREIKRRYYVYEFAEIKWVRVSASKLDMYKELVDLFFLNDDLSFRAVVAKNKNQLNYEKFHLTHDDWYQRIYFLVLKEMVNIENKYSIFVDIKDTKGSEKISKLKNVLNRTLFNFADTTVEYIQLVKSDQIEILQLADLLIGAIGYANRGLTSNPAKVDLINYIIDKSGKSIRKTTYKYNSKFNIFVWEPRV